MSIEAMKQALDVLENTARSAVEQYVAEQKAITALHQAIGQAEKQEPVAWVLKMGNEKILDSHFNDIQELDDGTPLYTAPPRKKWVGLDDEDWMNVPDFQKEGCELDAAIYDWIEARLKEKNT